MKETNFLTKLGLALQGGEAINKYEDKSNLRQLGADLQAGNIDQSQYLKGLAATNPEIYSKLALAQIGIDQPADVKSWLYRGNLPEEQQKEFDAFRRAPQWLNTGGAFVNPVTNNAIPINLAPGELPATKQEQAKAAASGKIQGEKTTEAQTGLADFMATTGNQLSIIDQMIGNKERGVPEHPGLKSAVGGFQGRLPSVKDDTLDFEALLEQAKSGAFLESISRLQGFGALSNEEGKTATAAATRMRTLMGEEGFRKAAKEYRDIITKGVERMQKKAGVPEESIVDGDTVLSNSPSPTIAEKVVKGVEGKALAMPSSKVGLKANQLYNTPRGVALWDGEKFIQE